MKNTKRIITCALLTAVSLALFCVELLIPSFPFCPGAKIGLANVITLFMLTNKTIFRKRDCILVLISRCMLSALLTGRMVSVLFGLSGGIVALAVMTFIRFIFDEKHVLLMSISGAVFHNLGQVVVAISIYGTFSIFYYIPSLFLIGILCGSITGLCVVFINKANLHKLF